MNGRKDRPELHVLPSPSAPAQPPAAPIDPYRALLELRAEMARIYHDRAWGDFTSLMSQGGVAAHTMPGLVQAAGVLADAIAIHEDARAALMLLDGGEAD